MRCVYALFALLSILSIPAGAAITGVVIDEQGAAIAGASVQAFGIESGAEKVARWMSDKPDAIALTSAVSDAKGKFSLEVKGVELVALRISANGYATQRDDAMANEEIGAVLLEKARPSVIPVTADGKPVAGALAVIDDDVVRTDEAGRLTVDRSASRVVILADGFAPFRVTLNAREAMPKSFALTRGRRIAGKVTDEKGAPVAGARIFADEFPVTQSGEDGSFVVAHAAQAAEIRAFHGGRMAFAAPRAAQNEVTLRLDKESILGGTITEGGTPLAGVMVRAFPTDGQPGAWVTAATAVTDAKGAFRIAGLAPGSYRIFGRRPGYEAVTAEAALRRGETVTRALSASKSAVVTGTVLDEHQRGVAGARVQAEAEREDGPPMMRVVRQAPAKAHAGPDGAFVLRSVSPARPVTLSASRPGLPAGTSAPLRVAAGEVRRGISIVIPRGITLEGRVVDRDGNPLAGAKITTAKSEPAMPGAMVIRRITMGTPDTEQSITTGADGAFRLQLAAGSWDVTARREGSATRLHRAVDVRPGVEPITLTLDEGFTLTGRVVRKDGTGVPDVNVNLITGGAGSARTGGDGSFAFPDLERGSVMLMATKPEEFIAERRNAEVPSQELVIELPPTGTIRGRVIEKGSKNPVTDFRAGLSGERRGQGVMIRSMPSLRPFQADDGTFELTNVPAGTQEMLVQAAGYVDAKVPNLEVEEGKVLSDVEILLDAGATVTGRVLGPDGAPAADAQVMRVPAEEERMMRMPLPADEVTATDAEGRFTIEGLAEGEHVFRASKSGLVSDAKAVKVSGKEASVELRLSAGDTLTGQVVTESGAPVADANVSANNDSSRRSSKSDAGGAFRLEGLGPGRYVVRASKSGYVMAEQRDVDASSGAPVRLVLSSGGTITGRIFGLSESELTSVTISASAADDETRGAASPDGSFRIEGVPVGVVQVRAFVNTFDGSRRSAAPKTVEVPAGGMAQVDLDFSAGSTVRGRVTRNGQPVAGANVNFAPANRPGPGTSPRTDANGLYEAIGLEDGPHRVNVFDMQTLASFRTEYTVSGPGTFDIEMRGSSVRGAVVDSSTSEPVAGATLALTDSSTQGGRAAFPIQSNAAGEFVFDAVSPGNYVLRTSKNGYGQQLVDVMVGDDGVNGLEIRLQRSEGTSVRVVDARDGRAIQAVATVVDGAGRTVWQGSVRSEGKDSFTIPLAPGSYEAEFWANGYGMTTRRLQSPGPLLVIAMTPGGELVVESTSTDSRRFRILDAGGRPFGGGMMTSILRPGVNPLGNFAPGTYALEILDGAGAVVDREPFAIGEGQVTRLRK